MNVKPLHNRIIVRQKDPVETTASGIVLSPKSAEKSYEGEVIAVGPGRRNKQGDVIPMSVSVGDRILFGKYNGEKIVVDGEELIAMTEDDVFCIVEE